MLENIYMTEINMRIIIFTSAYTRCTLLRLQYTAISVIILVYFSVIKCCTNFYNNIFSVYVRAYDIKRESDGGTFYMRCLNILLFGTLVQYILHNRIFRNLYRWHILLASTPSSITFLAIEFFAHSSIESFETLYVLFIASRT